METLGGVALIPKVEVARQRARDSMLKARAGRNPVAERRERERVAAEEVAEAKANTFRAVFERYLDRYAKTRQNAKTFAETLRLFNKDSLPRWADQEITAITEKDVRRLRDDVHGRAPIQANRMLRSVKTLFGWALRERMSRSIPRCLSIPLQRRKRAIAGSAMLSLFVSGTLAIGPACPTDRASRSWR